MLTKSVLYGVFLWIAAGMVLSMLRMWWMRRPLKHMRAAFADAAQIKDLKGVYRFKVQTQARAPGRFWGIILSVGHVMMTHGSYDLQRADWY